MRHRISWRWRTLLALLLLCGSAPPALAADPASTRSAFKSAWTAGAPGDGAEDSAALRSYRLYPYLEAKRLERAVDDPRQQAAIGAFLERVGDQPAARRLRSRWLDALGRQGRWATFQQAYLPSDDPGLRCYDWQARQALARSATAAAPDTRSEASRDARQAEALALGLLPRDLPAACTPVQDWLRAQGLMTDARVEARAMAAVDEGQTDLARALARSLPADAALRVQRVVEAVTAPEAALRAYAADGSRDYRPAVVQEAYFRWAKRAPDQALQYLPTLAARLADERSLSPVEQAEALGQLHRSAALGAAWSRRPQAVAEFRQVPDALADERVQEWRLRSALWADDWRQARQWIEAMPEALRQQPRWRYWQARIEERNGDADHALAGYRSLALERDYYGYLAADRIGAPYQFNHAATAADPARLTALEQRAALQRARELLACGLRDLAAVEWAQSFTGADAADLRQGALLAARWQWYEQSIATLAKAADWNDLDLRYPLPYRPLVEQAAGLSRLPASWIYAVMRQESLYRPDARSRADALGLLQLQPATAQAVAKRFRRPKPQREQLFDPSINLPLGALHLRELLDDGAGAPAMALAGFNAGPNALARWIPEHRMEADVWVENIPYNETRAYIQRILENIVTFSWRLDSRPLPRVSALLGDTVPGKAGDAS
jgi:soluble lytic murein transglycosylase